MEKFELKNRYNLKIIGVLEKPLDIEKIKGTAIIQHGWGDNRNKPTIQALKESFLISGFQVFVFDTTHSFGESDGDFEKSTLKSFWEDFEDVTNWLRKQNFYIGPLIVSGHSKGGYSAIRYTEEYIDQIYLTVAIAPVVSGELSFEAYKENDLRLFNKWKDQGYIIKESSSGKIRKMNWSQFNERLNHNLLIKSEKINKPILLIVGSKDIYCPPKHIEKLFDTIPGKLKSMQIIKNAKHSFNEKEYSDEMKTVVVEWLEKLMK